MPTWTNWARQQRCAPERIETPASEGELVRAGDGTDELRAARVSLGALGAIAAVTLRCVPAFTIHRIDKPRSLDDVLPRLDELVDSHDHFEAFAMP